MEVIQPRIFYVDYPNFGSCYHSNTYFFPSIIYSNILNYSYKKLSVYPETFNQIHFCKSQRKKIDFVEGFKV